MIIHLSSHQSDYFFVLHLAFIGLAAFSLGCRIESIQEPESVDWIQTQRYAGWILQNWWGDCTCNPEDTPGTRGQWGVAPDGILGWQTGLTRQDYKIDIKYHANPNCCGDQSAVSRIWIGDNDTDFIGVEFVGPAAPSIGFSRLMWNGAEIARTEKRRGQWHTYTIVKRGDAVTLQLDGNTVKTVNGQIAPIKLIIGGQCWTGCQTPVADTPCLYGNWNNFGYDIRFFVQSDSSILN